MFVQEVGIDLGTASVLIYVKGKGVILREPSVVALDINTGEIVAIGESARRMQGRTPKNIQTIRPLRDGVISDYDATEKMLRYFLRKAIGKRHFFGPRVMVCVPSGVTEVEKRSVVDAALDAGARYTQLIEEPVAAALGAGLDIDKPQGCMVVDIGGGTTDIAVISMGRPVSKASIRVAGDMFDETIIRYLRKRHNLIAGERTAEDIKVSIGGVYPRKTPVTREITGKNTATGLPRMLTVSSDEITDVLLEPMQTIIEAIHGVLENTPPELAADVYEQGMMLTGGGALLYGMERLMLERLGIPCMIADDAVSCVAKGTGIAIERIESWRALPVNAYRSSNHLR